MPRWDDYANIKLHFFIFVSGWVSKEISCIVSVRLPELDSAIRVYVDLCHNVEHCEQRMSIVEYANSMAVSGLPAWCPSTSRESVRAPNSYVALKI